jgi:cytochrome P450 family 6
VLYILIKKQQNYFERSNIPYLKSVPLIGALSDAVFNKTGIFENIQKIYNTPELKNEPFFGIFLFHKPAIFVKEPELIHRICVNDFNNFSNRYASSGTHDPIGYYELFACKNPLWKFLRSKFTPFFSSVKLKASYYLLEKNSIRFSQYIDERTENGKVELNLKYICDLLYIDNISSIAFGVEAHSLDNVDAEIQKVFRTITDSTFKRGIEFSATFLIPIVMKLFRLKTYGSFVTNFIYKFIPEVINERIKSGQKRNDIIDVMVELKKEDKSKHEIELTDDMIYAQAAVITLAGFETSSSTTSFTLYELSLQQSLQKRVRNEIKEMLLRHQGKLEYESVSNASEMPLLHQVIKETLRKYAVVPILDRICTKEYSLKPYSDFVIPVGMPVVIPIYPLGRDEKIFEDPLAYNPDRFDPENLKNYHPGTQVSFGIGPRNCIGERLAYIQEKLALVKVLMNFRVEANCNTPRDLVFVKKAMLIQSEQPLLIDFIKDELLADE